jgi:hypothetical protein
MALTIQSLHGHPFFFTRKEVPGTEETIFQARQSINTIKIFSKIYGG